MNKEQSRPLYVIAADINKHWPKPYFGAKPYIYAMTALTDMHSMFGAEYANSVVMYFLSNATTWRGEHARRIKAELKSMLKGGGK